MSSETHHIIDTVVLLYFLLVEEETLLGTLIGWPLRAPFAVYDPEDWTMPLDSKLRLEFLSEMRQAEKYYARAAMETGDTRSIWRVGKVDRLHKEGYLVVEEMEPNEQRLADDLQGAGASTLGLHAPLGPGEAACIAIAHEREWTIVTDDSDALKALARLRGNRDYNYERIRKLLIRAANERLISEDEANRIHANIVSYGFWDSSRPFP